MKFARAAGLTTIVLETIALALCATLAACSGGGEDKPAGGGGDGGVAADAGGGGSTAPTAQELQDAFVVNGATKQSGEMKKGTADAAAPQVTEVVMPDSVGAGKVFQISVSFHTGTAILQKLAIQVDGATGYLELQVQAVPNTDGKVSFPAMFDEAKLDKGTKTGALHTMLRALTASSSKGLISTKAAVVIQLLDEGGAVGAEKKKEFTLAAESGACTGENCTVTPEDGGTPVDAGTDAGTDAGCAPQCDGKCGGYDGCGGTCKDNCVSPLTCGGGGTANVCGCTQVCAGKCAGDDGCGGTCPNDCVAPETCGGGGVGSEDVCGCTPEDDTAFCTRLGKDCDEVTAPDNCGVDRTVATCGTCTGLETCGGGNVANKCGCTAENDPTFCLRLQKECGTVTAKDNCGADRTVTECGGCTGFDTCNGGGTPNKCGCTKETDAEFCTRLGKECGGPITDKDNCGADRTVTNCGACLSPKMCGGGGTANACGTVKATWVSAGGSGSCAVSEAGGVRCWGYGGSNMAGDGGVSGSNVTKPVDVVGVSSGAVSIATGKYGSCAVVANGAVKCWGDNAYGQLGDGTTVQKTVTVNVLGLTGVDAIHAGILSFCARIGTSAKCWGINDYYQLADGSNTTRPGPVDALLLGSSIGSIGMGNAHSCYVDTPGGAARCLGYNTQGQVGTGTAGSTVTSATVVSGLSSGVAQVSGGWQHTCAVTTTGAVKCWGDNTYGQIGDNTIVRALTPTDVTGLGSGAKAAALGDAYSCVLMEAGGVKCWGSNSYGQLGNGSFIEAHTPQDVLGATSGITMLDCAYQHCCALTTTGAVKCWGSNGSGQLGDGNTASGRSAAGFVLGFGQ